VQGQCEAVNQVIWAQSLRCTPQAAQECFRLASTLGNQASGSYMPILSLRFYELACEGGFVQGCLVGGGLSMGGQGVSIDHARSLKLYSRACKDLGDATGCYMAGMHHQFGYGTAIEWSKAAPFYERACRHETAPLATACRSLAEHALAANDSATAHPYLERCKDDESWCALKLHELGEATP